MREELLHVRSYLEIQQVRYQDILNYEINVPEEEGYFLNAVSLEALPQLVIEKGIIKISELKTHLTLLFKGK